MWLPCQTYLATQSRNYTRLITCWKILKNTRNWVCIVKIVDFIDDYQNLCYSFRGFWTWILILIPIKVKIHRWNHARSILGSKTLKNGKNWVCIVKIVDFIDDSWKACYFLGIFDLELWPLAPINVKIHGWNRARSILCSKILKNTKN